MSRPSSAYADGLDELIGAIYDCVIDPSRWRDTVDRIRRRYGFHNGVLGVNGPATNEVVLDIAINIPPDMMPVMGSNGDEIVRMWGGWPRIAAVPLEEPLRQSDVRPPDWEDGPYYRNFVGPQGIVDSVAIALLRDARTVANISFGVHKSRPPLTDDVLDDLRILAPHLRRAVVISRLLEHATATADSFAAALDASTAGVVLLDGERRIVHANQVARAMLAAGDPIVEADGQLELAAEVVAGALRRAIVSAAEAVAGSKGAGVPARRLDGTPLTVQIMPLERRRGARTPSRAVAAVFVSEASSGPATSAEILGVVFDLTPAEARVFALVVTGLGLVEIGAELSISPTTVKSHLARIYQKTGQNSRAGLVTLAHDVAPP